MIVYRTPRRLVRTREHLSHLQRVADAAATGARASHDTTRDLLIETGAFECGVADALSRGWERPSDTLRACRHVTLAAAGVCLASWRDPHDARRRDGLHAICHALAGLASFELPCEIDLIRPEGYAFYSVYPEAYMEAARAILREFPGELRINLLGLRSIGTSLSAAVSAVLTGAGRDVASWSARPHGHPYDRALQLSAATRDEWRRRPGAWVIVDEGPGKSGSSLAGGARAVRALGVSARSVLLLSHWTPDLSTFTEATAAEWRACRAISTIDVGWNMADLAAPEDITLGDADDVSAGRWRERMWERRASYPAVHPAHERPKWDTRERTRARRVKFIGLGHAAADGEDRARRSSDAGWGPPVRAVRNGLLSVDRVAGLPLSIANVSVEHLDRIARYIAWTRRTPSGGAAGDDDLWSVLEMGVINVSELLDPQAADALRRLWDRDGRAFADQPAVRLDARMFPHEWLVSGPALLKCDGCEHGDDHFFPGPFDISWDVAATMAEFRLAGERATYFLDACAHQLRDRQVDRRTRLVLPLYLAARAAYTRMAADDLAGTPDGRRMRRASRLYVRALRARLA